MHPHDVGLELVGDLDGRPGGTDDIASAGVDLVGERERDRLAGDGLVEVAVHRDDPVDDAGRTRRQHADRITGTDRAPDDASGEPTEVEVRSVHPLHRHAERSVGHLVVDRHGLEVPEQRRAVVPRRLDARLDDVVAAQRGQRDERDVAEADPFGELEVLLGDRSERLLRVVDEVHLVDRHHDPLDAEQRHEIAVAPRLGQDALAGVDEDHRDVGRRGAGHHVPRVLLVARRVGDDELATLGGEEPVRDVDRDALLAFGRQSVEQQREVEVATLCADLRRVDLERGQMVLEHEVRLVQEAPDERALAVVDAAARDEPQQALVLVRTEVLVDVDGDEIRRVRHQKYPSCFFFSIEPALSKSMIRPWRSDVVASSISWMMSISVVASLSIAPDNG